MAYMLDTLRVLNDERSNAVRDPQLENILLMYVTLPVLKDERLNSVKALQS